MTTATKTAKATKGPTTIDDAISVSWAQLKGYKGSFWWMLIKILIPVLIVALVLAVLLGIFDHTGAVVHEAQQIQQQTITAKNGTYTATSVSASGQGVYVRSPLDKQVLINLIVMILFAVPFAAMRMLGVKRIRQEETQKQSIFQYMKHAKGLMFLALITFVIGNFGYGVSAIFSWAGFSHAALIFMLLCNVVSGIALVVLMPAMIIAVPLLIEKNLGGWKAFTLSVKLTMPIWLRLFTLIILGCMVSAFGALLLFIGLIWFLPLASMLYSSAYTITMAHHKL